MKNYIYKAKLNPDGSRYVDPITNDYVNELVDVIEIPDPIETVTQPQIDLSSLTQEQIESLKLALSKL